ARTRNQIRLCILRGPGVIITPVDVCIGVSVLSGSGPPLGERSKIHRGHLSQNELVDGVLRTIALLMLRNPVRTLGPEMEDRNLSVRVGDEPVLIGDLINYSDEVVKPLALVVLGNEPDKEVRVVNVHSDALVFLGAAHLDPPTLDGELLDPDRKSTRLNSSHVKISY